MQKTLGTLVLIALISQLLLGTNHSVAAQDTHLDISTADLAENNIYRVTTGGATSTPCGGSWTEVCELQTALDAASVSAEIWVAAGTYTPTSGTDRSATFQLKSGVAVYGGFAGNETNRDQRDPNPATNGTILSGDIGTPNNLSDNSYHVVTASGTDSTALLDGFTITAGQADGNYVYPCGERCGGGMYLVDGSPTLRNLTFSGNSAYTGGGMRNYDSSPTLMGVIFSGNWTYVVGEGGGGGMSNENSNPTLTDVTFSGNSAFGGGGMDNINSSPTLTNVTFTDNSSEGGGGMHNYNNSSPTLTGVTFNGNSAYNGGGMYNSLFCNPMLTNVSFSGNSAPSSGGGMYNGASNPMLTNVSFSGNSAVHDGGGMLNASSSPELTNVTFSGNSADEDGGGMYNFNSSPELRNTILWNNRDSSGTGTLSASIYNDIQMSSTVTLTHSLLQGSGGSLSWTSDPNYVDNTDNLDIDPMFVQPIDPTQAPTTSGDLHLGADSPAIDAGDNQYVNTIITDLDGFPRIYDGDEDGSAIVDMGAYEYQFFFTLSVSLAGTGVGSVSSAPGGIDCGTDCYESYADGTAVTLTATAEAGSTFSGWSGACTNTSGDCLVTMNEAKSVTATFTLNQYLLSVSLAGDGYGSVTSDPTGIDCGTDCSQSYDYGTLVTLIASAGSNSTFSGWSGACTNTSVDCLVTMNEAKSVTAAFTLNQYLLSVSLAGEGYGSVTSDPAGINCPGDCSESYDYGTLVTLTASPEAGSTFSGWSGACTNTTGVCTLTMTAPREGTATFVPAGPLELFLPLTLRNH